jgi:hypothetical protein
MTTEPLGAMESNPWCIGDDQVTRMIEDQAQWSSSGICGNLRM